MMKLSHSPIRRVIFDSICTLGNGFIDGDTNPKSPQGMLGELIGLVYRLLCMAIGEQNRLEQRIELSQILHVHQKSQSWKELCTYMSVYCSSIEKAAACRLWSTSVFPSLLRRSCCDHALKIVIQDITKIVRDESIHAVEMGWVYEELLSYEAKVENGSFFLQKTDQSSQKATGAHYTPKDLVDDVLQKTIVPILAQRKKENLLSIRVCDPSCGSGLFLLEAARVIAEEYARDVRSHDQTIIREVASSCIYGVDINPISVDVCILSLWLASGLSPSTLGELTAHIQQGNSILDLELCRERGHDLVRDVTFFSWKEAFPKIYARENPGFDCMIGNPPWISFSGRHAHSITVQQKRIYQFLYEGFVGWLALHSMFVELSLRHLRESGVLGLVLPRQMADLSGYAAIRNVVRQNSVVQEPLSDFGEGAFVGVEQPSFALVTQKKHLAGQGERPFVLQSSDVYQTVIDAYLSRLLCCKKPPKECFRDIGIHTGNCSKSLIHNVYREGYVPVYEGKNIVPFQLKPPNRWLNVQHQKKEGEYYTVRSLEEYQRVRILIRQTANRPIAAKHLSKTYFRNSVLACYGIESWSDEETVLWLNSTAVAFFHLNSIREARQNAFPQIKIGHLRNLPIPFGSIGDEEKREERSWNDNDQNVSSAFGFSAKEHQLLCTLYDYQCTKQRYDFLRSKPKLSMKKQTQYEQLVAEIGDLKNTISDLLSYVDIGKE